MNQKPTLPAKENMVYKEKKTTCGLTWLGLIAATFFCLQPIAAFGEAIGGACTEGNGVPPFLSSGADPNLLLILDNSGSMLDMGYLDPANNCTDNTYDTTKTYVGNFNPDTWYTWNNGIDFWEPSQSYDNRSLVYDNGIVYQANCVPAVATIVPDICTSDNVTKLEDDSSAINWLPVPKVAKWTSSQIYVQGDMVQFGVHLYLMSYSTPTVIGADNPATDVSNWEPIVHTWSSDKDYVAKDVVSYQGMLFQLVAGASLADTRTSSTIWDDVSGGSFPWVQVDEGSFAAVTNGSECDNTDYSNTDVCIEVDETTTPKSVPTFSAKGKFLNWASASKFDIQKSILTGGKYSNETQQLISENRGCAGSGFIKGVDVVDSANKTWVLSFRVGGPEYDNDIANKNDWVDTSDYTTRIEILGLTDGPLLSGDCQLAIDGMLAGANLQSLSGVINDCLTPLRVAEDPELTDQRPMLNHALQFCEKFLDPTSSDRNMNAAIDECETLYLSLPQAPNAYLPWEISPYYGGYACYGLYDPAVSHRDRLGYIGRCWNAGASGAALCGLKAEVLPVPADPWLHADGSLLRNNLGHLEYCTDTKLSLSYYCKKPDEDWVPVYEDGSGNEYINDPTCGDTSTVAEGWTPPNPVEDIDCDDADDPLNCVHFDECVFQGMADYCRDMQIPEVIDPSDEASDTNKLFNAPATLIDSGVIIALGTDRPLAVMKGYIQQTSAPTGILHQVAPNLRLGAMAFNNNGAATECLDADPADAVVEYCPADIKDGARLISPILPGTEVTDIKDPAVPTDDVRHIDNLTLAINDIRATAWTPLAEALYTAIAYYGQNTTRRLNSTDFLLSDEYVPYVAGTVYPEGQIASYNGKLYIRTGVTSGTTWTPDISMWWAEWYGTVVTDPVQYWCQSNNILVITEGASTADINPRVAAFATSTGLEDGTVSATDEVECLAADGTSILYGSTYLDDLTYYAQNADVSDLYTTSTTSPGQLQSTDGSWHDKQNISTYIVTTGVLRDEGTGECNPLTIMTNAATNGGTDILQGENPAQLESNLKDALADIMSRASAGSAASVISSSRTGEGAAYQAIFWPKVSRGTVDDDDLAWIGDVHSLFVDTESRMWDDYSSQGSGTADPLNVTSQLRSEDTNGNGQLETGEDTNDNGCLDGDRRIFFYFDQSEQLTKICFNDSVRNTYPPVCEIGLTDYCGTFTEPVAIKDFHDYLWSANTHLQSIDDANITLNRPVDNITGRWDWTTTTAKRRYIFTWNDLNNDGIVDNSTEVLALDNKTASYAGTDWQALSDLSTSDPTNYPHDILADFNVADVTEMNEFVNWLRGADEVYEYASTDADGNGTIDPIADFVQSLDDTNGNGKQDYVYRCRRYPLCDPNDTANNPEWRLGDIIHSTPTLVAQPGEGYHTLYRDPSYAWFVKKWRYRRQVVYFGANDGMMHAMNSGFFNEKTTSFCRGGINLSYNLNDTDITNDNPCIDSGPDIGDELWAYVPYNLAPHLKCMSDPGYDHKYFVDQKPRIMDVQIFAEEPACTNSDGTSNLNDSACIHPYGWGTILIGAMRFGGAPVDANTDPSIDNRRFISSYFILDVTDPERPPELLGEMTMTRDTTTGTPEFAELGYTVPVPTGVVMRADNGQTSWHLVFGNGPTTLKGENNQLGKVAVLPLNWLKGEITWNSATLPKPTSLDPNTKKPFRIPNVAPVSGGSEGGIISIPIDTSTATTTLETSYSFTGDLVNVDYDIAAQTTADLGALYRSDAIYFGTVDGKGFAPYDATDPLSLYNPLDPNATHWDGGGRLYRLVTQKMSGTVQVPSTPDEWEMKLLLDAKAPITGAPGIGWDGFNYWIYFGTGRFFDKDDKTDQDPNYFFGVKEPVINWLDCASSQDQTWDEVIFDITATSFAPDSTPGSRGLFRADHTLVVDRKTIVPTLNLDSYVYCETGSTDTECQLDAMGLTPLTGDYYSFNDILDYIVGDCDATDTTKKGIDGWYRKFRDPRERNLGQSTLLGGLNTFTTYQPSSDKCTAEGISFLYGVHYQTGTAWYEDVIGTYTYGSDTIVRDKLSLGRGLATTPSIHVGTGPNDATAIIQTSTGEIVEVGEKDLPIPPLKPGKTAWTDQCN